VPLRDSLVRTSRGQLSKAILLPSRNVDCLEHVLLGDHPHGATQGERAIARGGRAHLNDTKGLAGLVIPCAP